MKTDSNTVKPAKDVFPENQSKVHIKIPLYGLYGGGKGAFSTSPKRNLRFANGELTEARLDSWYSCREQFSSVFRTGTPYIFVRLGSSQSKSSQVARILRFVQLTEKKLKLEEFSTFVDTDKAETVAIKVPKWWRTNGLRRQFYTALIRAGQKYTTDFERALFSVRYFSRTRKAVQKFLDGHTCLKKGLSIGGINGWERTFYRDSNLDKLIKPEEKTPKK